MKKLLLLAVSVSLLLIGSCKKDNTDDNTVKDIDGNVYHTVKIGNQTWMVENLKVTKYNDGTSIPNITEDDEWYFSDRDSLGAYLNYENNEIYATSNGRLYNFWAVQSKKLAPKGWHIPTEQEFLELDDFVSHNTGTSGSVAKALASSLNWRSLGDSHYTGCPGYESSLNNYSGFSALPSGAYQSGNYSGGSMGEVTYFWTTTIDTALNPYELEIGGVYRFLIYEDDGFYRDLTTWASGLSVRCIKD